MYCVVNCIDLNVLCGKGLQDRVVNRHLREEWIVFSFIYDATTMMHTDQSASAVEEDMTKVNRITQNAVNEVKYCRYEFDKGTTL